MRGGPGGLPRAGRSCAVGEGAGHPGAGGGGAPPRRGRQVRRLSPIAPPGGCCLQRDTNGVAARSVRLSTPSTSRGGGSGRRRRGRRCRSAWIARPRACRRRNGTGAGPCGPLGFVTRSEAVGAPGRRRRASSAPGPRPAPAGHRRPGKELKRGQRPGGRAPAGAGGPCSNLLFLGPRRVGPRERPGGPRIARREWLGPAGLKPSPSGKAQPPGGLTLVGRPTAPLRPQPGLDSVRPNHGWTRAADASSLPDPSSAAAGGGRGGAGSDLSSSADRGDLEGLVLRVEEGR